jgi:hypothetical protein
MKVTLKKPVKSYEYYNTYLVKIDKTNTAEVNVSATVYKLSDIDIYDVDIREIEVEFLVNGIMTQYSGFKELYDKLYGNLAYNRLCDRVGEAAKTEFLKKLDHPNLLVNMPVDTAKKYINKLLQSDGNYNIGKTTINKDGTDVTVYYTTNYQIKQLIRAIDKKLIINHTCLATHGKATEIRKNEIGIVDSIINAKTIKKHINKTK